MHPSHARTENGKIKELRRSRSPTSKHKHARSLVWFTDASIKWNSVEGERTNGGTMRAVFRRVRDCNVFGCISRPRPVRYFFGALAFLILKRKQRNGDEGARECARVHGPLLAHTLCVLLGLRPGVDAM